MSQGYQHRGSDFSDFSDASDFNDAMVLLLYDDLDSLEAIAATFRRVDNLCASLVAEIMKMAPEVFAVSRDLSLPVPSIGSAMQTSLSRRPFASNSSQNAAAPKDVDGTNRNTHFQPSFPPSPDPMDPSAEVDLASAFQLLELGVAEAEQQPVRPSA